MTRPLSVALVGLGSVSQRGILPHLATADARELLELRAVCDIDADRAASVAQQVGIPAWYDDFDDLLRDAAIDAVLLATPTPLHHRQALAAIGVGKHVYVQKTMTTNVAEADELVEAARMAGVTLVASPGQLLSRGFSRVRELLDDGAIGKVYWSFGSTSWVGHEHDPTRSGGESASDPSWYYRPGGGPLSDMGVYSLHAITGILGPARRVTSLSTRGLPARRWNGRSIPVSTDDNSILLLEFDDSTLAVVGSHYCAAGRTLGWGFLGFYGSEGSLEVTELEPGTVYPRRLVLSRFDGSEDRIEELIEPELGPAHHLQEAHVWLDIRHFAESIIDGRTPIASGEHARHVVEIIEMGYAAAGSGRTQALTTVF